MSPFDFMGIKIFFRIDDANLESRWANSVITLTAGSSSYYYNIAESQMYDGIEMLDIPADIFKVRWYDHWFSWCEAMVDDHLRASHIMFDLLAAHHINIIGTNTFPYNKSITFPYNESNQGERCDH